MSERRAVYTVLPVFKDRLSVTSRQWEVISLICEGVTTAECARRLGISQRTVLSYVSELKRVCGVQSLPQLVYFLCTTGLMDAIRAGSNQN